MSIGGFLLIGLGVLHTLAGIIEGWPQMVAIIDQGLWNALGQQSQDLCINSSSCLQMNGIWWFTAWGLMLVLYGFVCLWIERSQKKMVPEFISWFIFFIATLCAVLMPESGFWLVSAVAVYMVINTRHQNNIRRKRILVKNRMS